ncbi:MAG: thiol peroxidase [Cyclobacteriaceae bacterium]
MAQITLKGNPINTNGTLPLVDGLAPDFTLTKSDLSESSLSDYKGKKVILNIFPSLDTGTCAASVRTFNKAATELDNTVVLCISMDLPFAHARFCAAEGIENVITLSCFRDITKFADSYGIKIITGPLKGLNARSIVTIDESGHVLYTELVPETTNEPNYEAALASIK